MKKTRLYRALMIALSAILVVGGLAFYIDHELDKRDHDFCELLNAYLSANPTPPPTEYGKKIRIAYTKLRTKKGCDGYPVF